MRSVTRPPGSLDGRSTWNYPWQGFGGTIGAPIAHVRLSTALSGGVRTAKHRLYRLGKLEP
jgi:hypothetical protein